MQIQIDREALLKPVNMVAGVVERRQTLPILSYLLLRAEDGRLTLTGTDLEVEMLAVAAGRVDKPGEVTVPARKVFDICRALPEGSLISIAKQGEKVVLKAGKSRFSLSTLPAADFPKVEGGAFDRTVTMEAGALKRLLDRTAFCMAQQDVRYYLNGLFLEVREGGLRGVATDGHRMAVADAECDISGVERLDVIVPRKAVHEIGRLVGGSEGTVQLEFGANHMRLTADEVVFTSKLIDGKFPDYTKVIPNNQSRILRLDRQVFREALGRVAILANEKYRGIRLGLGEGLLQVSAHNPDQEEAFEEVETEYKGEPMEIGFNVGYLIEAAAAIESETLILGLNDPNSSCTLRPEGSEGTLYVVMPMRL
jgi:DNA polymerase-3 subunit beta